MTEINAEINLLLRAMSEYTIHALKVNKMGRQQLQRHVVEVIIGGTTFVNVLVDTHTNSNYMSLQNRS